MKQLFNLLVILSISQWAMAQQQTNTDIRVNLGGPDVYYQGSTYDAGAGYSSYYSNSAIFKTAEGALTIPPSIFHSERYSPTTGPLIYTVPVPNGTYTVRTHHAELYFGKHEDEPVAATGQRVFDITLEGVLKVDDHDLYLLNGNNPLTHTFENITVNDGVLDLVLDPGTQRSTVTGIAIEGPNADIYVNVGSFDDVDFNGDTYIGDRGLGYSASLTFTNATASTEALFQTERYMQTNKTELTYAIPVIDGTYTVKTHHNELWFGKSTAEPVAMEGQRVFDIAVEGQSITGFDLHKENNLDPNANIGDPITKVFTGVSVTDGVLNITLTKDVENPNISGISIESTGGGGSTIYINTGGGDVTYDGKNYLAENRTFNTNNSPSRVYSDTSPVSPLFTSERYTNGSGGTLSYSIPVAPNQTYTVKTHHNELYFGKSPTAPPTVMAGQRVLDILIEGALKVDDLDLFVENGYNPYTHTFTNITVGSDGILNIDFDASVQRANIAGISVEGPNTAIYINAGSTEDHEFNGDLYLGDEARGYGASATFEHVPASSEPLFQTERYMKPNKTELAYGFEVPNGTYTVKTHHNELWFGKAGGGTATADQRKFDIYVEDVLEADGFDLSATNIANGDPVGDPFTHTFTGVSVTDGFLNLRLVKEIDNPNISGISIERTDATGTDIYINTGGGTVTYQGNTYVGENDYFVTTNAGGNVFNNDTVTGDLFQSERYATSGTLAITVPVENGVYTVETYHNELWFGFNSQAPAATSNQRRKDITIEGVLVEDDFDLYDHTSGTNEPTVLTYENIEVTDGQLDLVLTAVVENPNLNGFAIIRTGNPGSLDQEGDETKAPYASINVSNDRNYVLTRTYHEPMGSFAPVNESDVMEEIAYVDGLGRPMQQIALKASQDKKDIITHVAYDDYGRMEREFLPYEPLSGANGAFRTDGESGTVGYYQSNYSADLDGSPNPFSQKEFEASPLGRVKKQAAPGKDWKLGSGHEIIFDYQANDSDDVLKFEVTFNGGNTEEPQLSGGTYYYPAGELYKNITKDENWDSGDDHTTEEYTDKQGRVVLKRTYSGTAHDTYYVYDDFGNLTYVIPPKVLVTTGNGVSTNEMNELCYQYRYDKRNRMIRKKVPGKAGESIVYDKLDRPIMIKDALNPWVFTKYDAFGRVAYTGFAGSTGNRSSKQALADAHATQWTNQTGTTVIDGITVYYDDGGYPTAFDITELHTINYYDGYNTARDGLAKPLGPIQGQPLSTNVRGLATVSKVRALETNDWITTLTAYDVKGRPVYTKSENSYLNTVDIIESKLDFAGKPVLTQASHQKNGGTAIVTVDQLDYDHANRPLKQRQVLSGNTEMIAFNTYDGTGQLTEKKVGRTKADALQEVDYTYNIRGWLKTINQDTDDDNDLFDFGIRYNDPTTGTPLFNGNISQTDWATASTNTTANPVSNRYTYTYDALNRITGAVDNTTNYNLSSVTYDKNGNIQALHRKGISGTIDNLDYDYLNGETSNRLAKVADAANDPEGFKDGTNSGDDYTYDLNGNMTSDANKGITGITYNHLNLPEQVDFGSDNIKYVYDATGMKLKRTSSNGTETIYTGNHIYEGAVGNAELQFFTHPEGYVTPDGQGGYNYVYNYIDHLGSVRLSYTDADGNGSINPANEIIEENNFYPYGLKMKGFNEVVNPHGNSAAKRWKYNGKELDSNFDIDTYDFGARNYDPTIGRWMNIDPLAEKYYDFSGYNYTMNNPILFTDPDGMRVEWGEGLDAEEKKILGYLIYQLRKNSKSFDKAFTKLHNSENTYTVTDNWNPDAEFDPNKGNFDIEEDFDFDTGETTETLVYEEVEDKGGEIRIPLNWADEFPELGIDKTQKAKETIVEEFIHAVQWETLFPNSGKTTLDFYLDLAGVANTEFEAKTVTGIIHKEVGWNVLTGSNKMAAKSGNYFSRYGFNMSRYNRDANNWISSPQTNAGYRDRPLMKNILPTVLINVLKSKK